MATSEKSVSKSKELIELYKKVQTLTDMQELQSNMHINTITRKHIHDALILLKSILLKRINKKEDTKDALNTSLQNNPSKQTSLVWGWVMDDRQTGWETVFVRLPPLSLSYFVVTICTDV
jgi:hypothetical protein